MAAVLLRRECRAASEHHSGGFDPPGSEGCLELSNCRAFEANVRLAPRTVAAAVAKPLVIDAEPSRPPHPAVDDDAAHV